MDKEYYTHKDYQYLEICTCLEDSDGPMMKINIPVLMPSLPADAAYETLDSKVSTKNIKSKNKNQMDIQRCTTSNYIEVYVPSYVLKVYAGDMFVVAFMGGDQSKPYIVGRYPRA